SSVKALGHKVRSVIFFQKSTLIHVYSCRPSHQVIRHFDASIAQGRSKLRIVYSIKLDDPVRKSSWSFDLTTFHFACFRVKSYDSLGSCTSRRGSDLENIRQCRLLFLR